MTFFPPNLIEVKPLEFVNPKVVNPANVTVELACSFERSIEAFAGAAISCNVMFLQEATAGAICAYAVQMHEVVFFALAAKEVVRRSRIMAVERILSNEQYRSTRGNTRYAT